MNPKVLNLTCRVSDAVYRKYLESKHGIRSCTGKLKDKEIMDILEDLDLLNYKDTHKSCDCDGTKLIDYLT